jgi:hypothetical protein
MMMPLMKQKINLATIRVKTLVTVSVSFLTIIGGVFGADVESQILSHQSPHTIPHKTLQASQPPLSDSLLAGIASENSTGELKSRGALVEGIGATQEEENLERPAKHAYQPLLPKVVTATGSQGGAD